MFIVFLEFLTDTKIFVPFLSGENPIRTFTGILLPDYFFSNFFNFNKFWRIFPGTYLYIESSSPQKPGDTGRLNSATIKGTSRDCTVRSISKQHDSIPQRICLQQSLNTV